MASEGNECVDRLIKALTAASVKVGALTVERNRERDRARRLEEKVRKLEERLEELSP